MYPKKKSTKPPAARSRPNVFGQIFKTVGAVGEAVGHGVVGVVAVVGDIAVKTAVGAVQVVTYPVVAVGSALSDIGNGNNLKSEADESDEEERGAEIDDELEELAKALDRPIRLDFGNNSVRIYGSHIAPEDSALKFKIQDNKKLNLSKDPNFAHYSNHFEWLFFANSNLKAISTNEFVTDRDWNRYCTYEMFQLNVRIHSPVNGDTEQVRLLLSTKP